MQVLPCIRSSVLAAGTRFIVPAVISPGIEQERPCAGPKDTAYEGGLFVVDIQLGKRCFTNSSCTEITQQPGMLVWSAQLGRA